MPVSQFIQRYINNRHNLFFALIVVVGLLFSIIPELILQQAKDELLKTIHSSRILTNSHSDNDAGNHPSSNIPANPKLLQEWNQYQQNLQEYEKVKQNIMSFTHSLGKIEAHYQSQLHEQLTKQQQQQQLHEQEQSTIRSSISLVHENLQNQYEKVLINQQRLTQTLQQLKDHQLLQLTQAVELQNNLTAFKQQQDEEKEHIYFHLQRLQDRVQHYQLVLNQSHQRQDLYRSLFHSSDQLSKGIQNIMKKVKYALASDEKLCKERLALSKKHNVKFQKEIFENLIKASVNEKLQSYAYLHESTHQQQNQSTNNQSDKGKSSDGALCFAGISSSVQEKLDYALITAGAEVILPETSPTYVPHELQIKNALHQVAQHLGMEDYFPSDYIPDFEATHTWTEAIGLFYGVGSVQDVLRPDIRRGNCWPMNGTFGYFTLKLKDPIFLESISLDHIGKDEARDWRTAPKDFKVFGSLRLERGWRELIADTFEPNATTSTRNYIIPTSEENSEPVQYLKLNILNNHGYLDYTCIYRFRVHGEPI